MREHSLQFSQSKVVGICMQVLIIEKTNWILKIFRNDTYTVLERISMNIEGEEGKSRN